MNPAAQAVGSILRFDKKVNSYKLALVRALNDVVLSYPNLSGTGLDVCVPLRKLAEYWLAYYWPFVDPQDPVMQGPRAMRRGVLGNDMSFRPALTDLRFAWKEHFGTARPSDGFLLVAELRVPRIAAGYPVQLQRAYRVALTDVRKALAQPIRYAGPGGETHRVFPPPRPASDWLGAVAVPGTSPDEPSLLVRADLWSAFRELSLWIEAWCPPTSISTLTPNELECRRHAGWHRRHVIWRRPTGSTWVRIPSVRLSAPTCGNVSSTLGSASRKI